MHGSERNLRQKLLIYIEMNGIIDDPEDRPMRQVPSISLPWTYTVWISEIGVLRPRHYDIIECAWAWGAIRHPVVDSRGRMGFHVYGVFRTIEQTIALAWIPRCVPSGRLRSIQYIEGSELVAHNLGWKDEIEEGTDCSSESTDVPPSSNYEWFPLRFKIGVITCDFPKYKVSRCGCIKTPGGDIVKGVYTVGVARFGILPNIGMVNLEEVVRLLNNQRGRRSAPRFSNFIRQLRAGRSIRSISRQQCIKESSAWAYAYAGMRNVSTRTARILTLQCLSTNVAAAMERLLKEAPRVVLTGQLQDLVYMMTQVLAADMHWRSNPHRYAEVRLMRAVLQREYIPTHLRS